MCFVVSWNISCVRPFCQGNKVLHTCFISSLSHLRMKLVSFPNFFYRFLSNILQHVQQRCKSLMIKKWNFPFSWHRISTLFTGNVCVKCIVIKPLSTPHNQKFTAADSETSAFYFYNLLQIEQTAHLSSDSRIIHKFPPQTVLVRMCYDFPICVAFVYLGSRCWSLTYECEVWE
jgi:hypothetical protein